MRHGTAQYQARRHPIAAFLLLLIFGPYLLAGALLVFIGYLIYTLLTLGRDSHVHRA